MQQRFLEVLHCNQSFHRGPILLLAVMVSLGLPPVQAAPFMLWLAGVRHIWRLHTAISPDCWRLDRRDLQTIAALAWAVPIQRQSQ